MDSPPPADQAEEDARHCRLVLMDLMDMAHGVARVMHRHVTAPPAAAEAAAQAAPASEPPVPAIPPLAAAASFDRAARNIRQTVILVGQIGRPKTPAARPGLHRIAARKRIIRDVEDVIQRTAHGPRAERLYAELAERLDGPDLEEELDYRQVAEIVTDLCRDLGLAHTEGNHPWKRRTPADIAALRARAARPPGAAPEALPIRPGGAWTGGAWTGPAWTGAGPAGGPAGDDPPDRSADAAAGNVVAAGFGAAGVRDRGLGDDEWGDEAPNDDGSGDDGSGDDGSGDDGSGDDGSGDDGSGDDTPRAPDRRGADLRSPALRGTDLPAAAFLAAELPDPDLADAEDPDPDLPGERAHDFCDYQPGARSWGAADPLIPRPGVPDITRPRGRASFRGG
jgi:hypothetical protein